MIFHKSFSRRQISAKCNHEIVEAELEAAMNEFLKADAKEHLLKNFDRNAFLVFVAFHFVAHEVQGMQHAQDRIDHRRGPGKNQRSLWREHAVRLAQYPFGFGEML